MCRNRSTVKDVSELEYDEIAFLDVIESDTAVVKAEGQPWMVKLHLNNREQIFKIDTGADVTVIPECTYRESHDGPLSPPEDTTRS